MNLDQFDVILNAFVTLLVTIDPVGTAPLFLGITAGMSTGDRRSVACRGTAIATGILILFAITGTGILDLLGITIDAFRIAGGLLLFYLAFEMIYGKRQERKKQTSETAVKEHIASIAVFPIAIPLLAGPGAISAIILLSSGFSTDLQTTEWVSIAILCSVILVLMLLTACLLIAAETVDKYLGNTGRSILTRLLGVLLAALSVQYVVDGARAAFST